VWQQRFGAALIVRHDKDGATWYDGDASGVVPAFPATVVDTIGAGDSHAGGAGRAGCGMVTGRCRSAGECRGVMGGQPPRRRLRPTRGALLLAHKDV
jgi:hypothetical protein